MPMTGPMCIWSMTKKCFAQVVKEIPKFPEADARIRLNGHRSNSWVRIILKEGKFRQKRKMTAAVGNPTLRLVRTRIGTFELGTMGVGEVLAIGSEVFDFNV